MSPRGGPSDLERQVRDALGHLHDYGRLQTHPLARLLPPGRAVARAGRALHAELLEAIDALRPPRPSADGRAGRAHALLTLRYVEGLDAAAVRSRLAVGHAEYFRELARAVAALASLLRERWRAGDARSGAAERARRGNLPAELTSFVGRGEETAAVARLLGEHRLVTLTGPGGVGKTRLALRAAAGLADGPPDGAWLVELAPLADERLVPSAVLVALGDRGHDGGPAQDAIVARLADREALLVLDNCEHLVGACAELAEALLRHCPTLRVLATSREPLGVLGEAVYPVPPLPVPPEGDGADASGVEAYPAAQLFVERARAAAPGFAVTEANAAAVARVCARLDGLPLAIELAAARARTLPVAEIAARLDDRFRLLGFGPRAAPPRHRTLRALVEWSHDLLTDRERVLLRRLAVFAGGFDLDAAERVCAGDGLAADEALETLDALVARSLVTPEHEHHEGSEQSRYRLLETVREYALEKLAEAGEVAALRERHLAHYTGLAERGGGYEDLAWFSLTAASSYAGSAGGGRVEESLAWRATVAREYPNLAAALGWCVERRAPAAGLRLALALVPFWGGGWGWVEAFAGEGRDWLEALVAMAEAPALRGPRAAAAFHLGVLTPPVEGEAKRAALRRAVELARAAGDERLLAEALGSRAWHLVLFGDPDARRHLEEASALAERVGGQVAVMTRHTRGLVAFAEGDLAGARAAFGSGLVLARGLGSPRSMATELQWIGHVAFREGDRAAARRLTEEALGLFRATDAAASTDECVRTLGLIRLEEGDHEGAAALLRASLERLPRPPAGPAAPVGDPRPRYPHWMARLDWARLGLEGLAGAAAAGLGRAPDPAAAAGRALRLAGAASTLPGAPLVTLGLEPWVERWLAPARALLGPEAAARAWDEGRAMRREGVLAYALADGGE